MADVPTDAKAGRLGQSPTIENGQTKSDASKRDPTKQDPEKPAKPEQWTLLEVLRWTTARFVQRALPTPRLDAEILIAAALGLPRVQLYVQFDRPLDASELGAIRDHVRRRQSGESVAYVVGHKEFFGLDFKVDKRVLVPRPDTETLVDEVLARVRARAQDPDVAPVWTCEGGQGTDDATATTAAPSAVSSPPPPPPPPPPPTPLCPRIADIGTGSGAIAVTLAKQMPSATLFAVDLSPDALNVARDNAIRNRVEVTFLEGDLTEPLAAHAPLDVIAANLPYVPTGELAGLAPEVRSEPTCALDGGPDGLDLVRRLVVSAPALLVSGGALVLEIGAGQAQATVALCQEAGFVDVRRRRDLGAIDRVVSAVKP